jgi:hypothetical protein
MTAGDVEIAMPTQWQSVFASQGAIASQRFNETE